MDFCHKFFKETGGCCARRLNFDLKNAVRVAIWISGLKLCKLLNKELAVKEKNEFYCGFYLHLDLWCAMINIGTLRFIHVGRSTCSKGHQQ